MSEMSIAQEFIPEHLFAEAEALTADIRAAIGDWQPPTDERWMEDGHDPILPALRLAWITVVHKSPAEVADIVRSLDVDALAHLMRQLNWTGGYLEKLQHLVQVAEVRLHVHGAPKAVQDWLEDSPHPKEPEQDWQASDAPPPKRTN